MGSPRIPCGFFILGEKKEKDLSQRRREADAKSAEKREEKEEKL